MVASFIVVFMRSTVRQEYDRRMTAMKHYFATELHMRRAGPIILR